ncbi:MAG TPA: CsgG/HfaB family protein [Candidatus Sulfotelmatobacter sp.]|nr:CsgG/HfaB family protein [Candidatus Sulfotelmatobacter sp.]
MKVPITSTLVVMLVVLCTAVAEATPVKVAIIPFSAPLKNTALQQAAGELPDLLMVTLSSQEHFEVVERTKVNAIWSELHLAEDGYVSADTAEKLGHILSCDWLVGGSLVQIGARTEVWIKVIDVRSGVVLDLKTFPYDPKNVSATVSSIPQYLAGIDSQSQPRQFIALGRFADQSLSSSRSDWSQRLPALIEKHFLAAGYGVVEREAIAPIFSEFQFESSGMTGDYTNRVMLKPAFWLVDGGYKWVYDTQEKLSVALRVQKVGCAPQIFRFDKPVADVEQAVVDSIQSALTNAPQTTPDQTRAAESRTDTDIAMKYAAGYDEFGHGDNDTIREDTLNKFRQAILLDPHAMQPKYMLGLGLFESADPEETRQGKEILDEVAASDDPKYSTMAKNLLDDFATGRLTKRSIGMGLVTIDHHGQPLSWPTIPTTNFIDPVVQALNVYTNIEPRAKSVAQIASPRPSGYFENVSAVQYDHGDVFVATKPPPLRRGRIQLFKYDQPTESTVEIKLPDTINCPINAIETDKNCLWLATEGNGLIQLSKTSRAERVFSEKDGFPTASVEALQWDKGRLMVGFNNHDAGYVDPGTGKFTGAMSDVNIFKSRPDSGQDGPLPPLSGTNANFMAALAPFRCIVYCPPHGSHWTGFNLTNDFDANLASSCLVDPARPNIVWIGGTHGKVIVVDLRTQQVIAECHLNSPDDVQWIFDDGDNLVILAGGMFGGSYDVYSLNKSVLDGQPVVLGPDPLDGDWPINFLRLNFSKFATVQFKKGPNGEAVLQRLAAQDTMFHYKDEAMFFGIKFTVPQWCDGDFQWMYALAKTAENQSFASQNGAYGIMTEDDALGDGRFDPDLFDDVNNYPRLHEIMPYSHTLHIQTINRDRLEPGKTYALWFYVEENDYPDSLFAMTIKSKRGLDEFGTLPLIPRQAP